MAIIVLRSGACVCVKEPRCEGGLEGYNLGETYRFEVCQHRTRPGQYVRVYHKDPAAEGYYEVCGPGLFRKFFEERS